MAIDTPAGLADTARPEQVIRFRPSVPIENGLLDGIPGVGSIVHTAVR